MTLTPSPLLVRALVLLAALGALPAVLHAGGAASGGAVVAFAVAAMALLAATTIDVALAPRARRVEARVDVPSTLALGVPGRLVVTLAPLRSALRVEIVADLDPDLEPMDPVATDVPAGAVGRVEVPLVPRRRGTPAVRAVHLRWTGPLGLVRRTRTEAVDRPVAVVPDLAPVRAAAIRFAFDREFLTGARRTRRAGDGSEFEALREHVAGLDPRAIDWKASARHLHLVSRETRAERDRPVVLALDLGRTMSETVDGMPRVDHAIQASLLLGYAALRSGDRVGLFSFDARPRTWLPPMSGPGAHARLLAATSGLAYSNEETNYTHAVADLSARLKRRTLVVVLTDFADSTTAELMLDALGHLARRHLVLFVALRDPALAALADAPPRTLQALHRAVVAADLLRDREVVLRRLRRLGAHVVDEVPARVTTAALDRYLHIHRRELVG